MAQYGKASYWDDRYTKDPEIFDWYQVRNVSYSQYTRCFYRLASASLSSIAATSWYQDPTQLPIDTHSTPAWS